jgi:hypothetical protein
VLAYRSTPDTEISNGNERCLKHRLFVGSQICKGLANVVYNGGQTFTLIRESVNGDRLCQGADSLRAEAKN